MSEPLNFRFLPYLRCTLAPGTGGTGVEGTPMVPACDTRGIIFTTPAPNSAAATGSGSPTSNPGAGAQASAAAPATAGLKNNATSLAWSYGDTAAGAVKTLVIRDGATGVGAIIWSINIGPLLAGDSKQGTITWPPGYGPGNAAINTALTAEFTTASAATGTETVSLTSYTSA